MSAGARNGGGEHLDYLAYCDAKTMGNPVLKEIRDRGADVVTAIFRLAKNGMIHQLTNEAVVRAVEQCRETLTGFAAITGGPVSVTFADQTVFLCGQLLRASRAVYDAARELGRYLKKCEVSEITFDPDVTTQSLLLLIKAFIISLRDPEKRDTLVMATIPGISVRQAEQFTGEGEEADISPLERILSTYATAYTVMQHFFESVATGLTIMPHKVKRLAQKLVILSNQYDASLLALITMAHAHRNDAGRAVQMAILSILVGKQITDDNVVLSRLAMAALLSDAGRVELLGPKGRNKLVRLPEDVEVRIPGNSGALSIITGGVSPISALRSTSTYEATWSEREALMGPPYGREFSPHLQSRLLYLVRAFLDRLAPRDSSPSRSAFDALQDLAQHMGDEVSLVRLLVAAVGIFPTGSVVELSDGSWGVVLGPSASEASIDRPRIKMLTNEKGTLLSEPHEVDLGQLVDRRRTYRITRVIEPANVRFNAARSIFG
jgi:hypothetical protein